MFAICRPCSAIYTRVDDNAVTFDEVPVRGNFALALENHQGTDDIRGWYG
jgi:hypothetical protein